MHRLFSKLSVCVAFCFVLGLHLHPVKAQSQTKSSSSHTKHISAKSNKEPTLVPPPPPIQPSLLNWQGDGLIPDSFVYLNADELNMKLSFMHKQIENAKLRLKDANLQLKEDKDKAERFESLFSEGVVSRKELETAQKELANSQMAAEECKNHLADLELQEGAIVRQISHNKRYSKNSKQTDTYNKKQKHQ